LNIADQVYWFRHSAPYINAHRGRTMVLLLGGEVLEHPNLTHIIHDIALLNSLGVRLVIVFGARPQIDQRLRDAGVEPQFHHGMRVTNEQALVCVQEAVGRLRHMLEARLSMGLINSPMHGAHIQVVSGNWVSARPIGVVNGVDLCHTGVVRKVDEAAISRQLQMNNIVLQSCIGYSPTGEAFNLSCEDVASSLAIALKADKLIVFSEQPGVLDETGRLCRELTVEQTLQRLEQLTDDNARRSLAAICRACQNGVKRAHIVSYQEDGALLQELFTRDGTGSMVTDQNYEQMRPATIDDVGGILELIRPLEEAGILVRRSRELLEREIGYFIVDERDGTIVGCAALYPFPEERMAELACVAVKSDYRSKGRGDTLLAYIEKQARNQGVEQLFVLTTQTAHWFVERGFQPASVEALPASRKQLYNWQRNSKVFLKNL